jgi:hypothetical protein
MAKKTDDDTQDPMIVIELDGELFSFPRDQDDWPTGSIVAASRVQSGRATYDEVVEALLGETQWARLKMLPFRSYKEFLKAFSANMDEINRA